MIFHIVTNVWGERHIDLFLKMTLPNLLSSGNLPSMRAFGQVRYRFFTTPQGRNQIEESPLYRDLARVCEVEFLTPLGTRQPDVVWHVHWFHRAAAEAKLAGAMPVFVPPDTLWADGSLECLARRLKEGYVGIACPFLLVTAESLLSCLEGFRNGPVLTIDAPALVRLGLQHLHPLHMLGMPGAPHGRPAFEMHWPVDRTTMLSRYAVRELVAFDPNRCPITFLWYAGGAENVRGLQFGADSDEMLMLSVDPIGKYTQNYILDHGLEPLDLARMTLHPLNDTRQTRTFIRRGVRLHAAGTATFREHRARRRSERAAIEMEAGRRALQIVRALQAHGARRLAQLVAVAVFETPLLRRWRLDEPLHAVAFTDEACHAGFGNALDGLAAPGREPELMRFIRRLVFNTEAAARGVDVHLLDRSMRVTMDRSGALRIADVAPSNRLQIEGTTLWLFDRLPQDPCHRPCAHGS